MHTSLRLPLVVLAVLGLVLPLAGCRAAQAAPGGPLQGTIAVSGAWALYPLMVTWSDEFHKANPGVTFDVSAGGAGKGVADALSGAVEIGMVSRDLTPEEEAKGAFWVAVVVDAVFPTASAQNPALKDLLARGLSQEAFGAIYVDGQVRTWGLLVGRPEVADEIHVYTRSDAAGAADTWAKYLGKAQVE